MGCSAGDAEEDHADPDLQVQRWAGDSRQFRHRNPARNNTTRLPAKSDSGFRTGRRAASLAHGRSESSLESARLEQPVAANHHDPTSESWLFSETRALTRASGRIATADSEPGTSATRCPVDAANKLATGSHKLGRWPISGPIGRPFD